ncbi:hypothetical protein [Adhaeribacter rhizoryzae]|uniref:hypothetical protein n=1 Tax=Adhaeribacter rhizoryzae TaxID=2607907 RepID=UPI00167FE1D6|nr:hypothetical protein [Adhaeribacter rhizoryzae]
MKSCEIESEDEYKTAAARLEIIAGAIPGTAEATELKHLTKAVVEYLKKQNQELARTKH